MNSLHSISVSLVIGLASLNSVLGSLNIISDYLDITQASLNNAHVSLFTVSV